MDFEVCAADGTHAFRLDINDEIFVFQACIFDFDGVIADTEKYHLAAWRKGFEKFGLTLTDGEYIPLKSTGKDNIIAFVEKKRGKKFSEKEKAEIYETKKAAFKQYFADMGENDLIGGAKEFLRELSSRVIKTAVASSASSARELIDRLVLRELFDVVFDGGDGFKKKPAPDIFLACAEKLKVEPKDCVVFEDSFAGIEAAVKAGMQVIAVGTDDSRALMKIPDFRCLL